MPPRPVAKLDQNRMTRFLHVVEWLGNALPHPVTLFAMSAAGVGELDTPITDEHRSR